MAGDAFTQDNRAAKLSTELGKDALLLTGFRCTERLSEPFTITVDCFSDQPKAVHTLLGTDVAITVTGEGGDHRNRNFAGLLWEYSEVDDDRQGNHYRLVLRPRTELMTLNKRNRIFQQKSVVEIAQELIVGEYEVRLSGHYGALDYCVQYQESDFAFVSRLLEYEGIYYFYEHGTSSSKMILIDDRNSHADQVPAAAAVLPRDDREDDARIWSLTERRGIGPAKVTVADYDFESPGTSLLKSQEAAKPLGSPTDRAGVPGEGVASWGATAEVYDFPAKYTSKTMPAADRYSAVWLDAHRRRMARSFADGTVFSAAIGRRLTLSFTDGVTSEYLIVGTVHDHVTPSYDTQDGTEDSSVSMELMPAAEQYRPALVTPRPRILGPQTALVVGPKTEEIYTDQYGRIKVQFFWDREGAKDERSSCFIRVMQSGAGQGWGSFALPRIGQEVVIEFLDGDPDRPLVTGAVYNAANAVPAALPANKTQFGLHTRSSQGGGGHNRLWFEDKKDNEVVWFRAERDYKATIANKDETRVYEKGHRTTTFDNGNDTLLLKKGNIVETVAVGTRTASINGDETLEVVAGNRSATIKMGNDTLKVSTGNVTVSVDLGSHKTTAMEAIELTCGGSKIKMDPMSISLEALTIKISATAMLQMKGVMVQSEASGIQTIKGGLVMIN